MARRRSTKRSKRSRRRARPRARTMKRTRRPSMRRRVNNHTFIRGQESVIGNIEGPLEVYEVARILGDINSFPMPTTIVGEVSPYGNTTSWQAPLVFAAGWTTNFNELTVLYDQYKINYVDVTFNYAANSGTADTSGTMMPSIALVADHDDALPEARVDLLQATSRVVRRKLSRPITYRVYPRVRDTVGTDTGSSTGNVATFKRMWLDCNSPNVPHFGLKVLCFDWPLFNTLGESTYMSKPVLRVQFKYSLSMKNVR